MDCELEFLEEDSSAIKYIKKDAVEDNSSLSIKKIYNDINYYHYDKEYTDKTSKKKKYKRLNNQVKSKKVNFMKSKIKQTVDFKEKNIRKTKKMCNYIKTKYFDSQDFNILPQDSFCDDCDRVLRYSDIYYNDKYKLCHNCYCDSLIPDDFDYDDIHYYYEYDSDNDRYY